MYEIEEYPIPFLQYLENIFNSVFLLFVFISSFGFFFFFFIKFTRYGLDFIFFNEFKAERIALKEMLEIIFTKDTNEIIFEQSRKGEVRDDGSWRQKDCVYLLCCF